jgi:hypothetical protein
VIPRFGRKSPLAIEPLEVEKWLREVKKAESLENPTLDKIRRVMNRKRQTNHVLGSARVLC